MQCATPLLVPPHRSPVICSARGNNEMIQKSIKLRNTDQLATAHASLSFSYSDDEITGHYYLHLVIIIVSTVCCSAALQLSAKTNLLSILRTVNTGGASYDEHYQIYTHSLLTGVPLFVVSYAQRSLNLCNVMPSKSLTER